MGESEIFDVVTFEKKVKSYVDEGKKSIAIDLSQLAYVYSNAINSFLSLNRHILDANGRLSLLSPNEKVRSLLDEAGIPNFIRVYESKEQLQKSSEDIIRNTQSISVAEVQALAAQEDKKEVQKPQPQSPESTSQEKPKKEKPTQPAKKERAPLSPEQKRQQGLYEEADKGTERFIAEDESPKKKSPLAVIIPIVLIIAVAIGAGIIWYPQINRFISHTLDQEPTRSAETEKDSTMQKASDAVSDSLPDTTAETSAKGSSEATKSLKAASAKKTTPSPQKSTPKPRPEPRVQKRRPSPATRSRSTGSASRPSPSRSQRTSSKVIAINSEPGNAIVKIDGEVKGRTPFTWENPNVYGQIKVTLSKDGYQEQSEYIEYLGNQVQRNFTLQRATPQRETEQPASRQAQPKPSPQKPQKQEEPAASQASRTPETKTPSPHKREQTAQQSPQGKPARVFISSIPPGAQVFMDGQYVGKTNEVELDVRSGTHTMRFKKGAKEHTEEMTFEPGKNSARHVTF